MKICQSMKAEKASLLRSHPRYTMGVYNKERKQSLTKTLPFSKRLVKIIH